jgi:serine/threonine protein kinase
MAQTVGDGIDTPPSDSCHKPGEEPIPGYRLLELLGEGGSGEVWKCEAPGGLHKAIKFVQGGLGLDGPAEAELRAIGRLKAVRHPFLLSLERVEPCGRELLVVLELADRSLADVLREQRQAGRPGIPRDRLLGYLREAAEALDLLNGQHDLQHLDVKPRNLLLVANHVKVSDFGLVQQHEAAPGNRAGLRLAAISPVYAAPELFENAVSPQSDQYSLAIVYQELLTGVLPFAGKNIRQLMLQHFRGEPDLAPLPEEDRPAVARALAKGPAARFPSCSDFVRALACVPAERPATPVALPEPPREASPAREAPARPGAPVDLGEETLEDLELLDCVRLTPLTEVRRARKHGGGERLVTLVFGCAPGDDDLGVLCSGLHHPALTPVKAVRGARGGLALISVPAGRPLRERFRECVAGGAAGIGRNELIDHLRAAGAALDFLAQRHGMAHLGLNTRNLLLDGDRLLLADFGLGHVVRHAGEQSAGLLNSRYSAPEVYRGRGGPAADQYSLALIYHEMLTGVLPGTVGGGGPGLDLLPAEDRPALLRALDPDPLRRWPSCTDLVRALETAGSEPAALPAGGAGQPPHDRPPVGALQARIHVFLPAEEVRGRLDGFHEQWKGAFLLSQNGDLLYRLPMPRSFWQRLLGRHPELEVRLHLGAAWPRWKATDVDVEVRPRDCGRTQGSELLQGVAPRLVENIRAALKVSNSGRVHERQPWRHPLQVCSVHADGTVGSPVECQGKDISPGGIGFYLPGEMPSPQLSLRLPETALGPARTLPARVVRVETCGKRWYEVGAVLLRPEGPGTEAVGGGCGTVS